MMRTLIVFSINCLLTMPMPLPASWLFNKSSSQETALLPLTKASEETPAEQIRRHITEFKTSKQKNTAPQTSSDFSSSKLKQGVLEANKLEQDATLHALELVIRALMLNTIVLTPSQKEHLKKIFNSEWEHNVTIAQLVAFRGNTEYCKLLKKLDFSPFYRDQALSSFHFAASIGDIERLKYYMDEQVDPNILDDTKCTALHYAGALNLCDSIQVLLTYKPKFLFTRPTPVDPLFQNNDGDTALHLATQQNHLQAMQLLAAIPGIIDIVNYGDQETALSIALKKRSHLAVRILLSHGANQKLAHAWSFCAEQIFKVTREQEITKLKQIVPQLTPDEPDEQGNTLLHQAVITGNEPAITILAPHRNLIDAQNGKRETALYLAVQAMSLNAVSVLTDQDANQQLAADTDLTPAQLCEEKIRCQSQREHIPTLGAIMLLLTPGSPDNRGNTILHNAVIEANYPLIKALAPHRLLKNAKNIHGNTPTHLAAQLTDSLAMELLLAGNPDQTIVDHQGFTPWSQCESILFAIPSGGKTFELERIMALLAPLPNNSSADTTLHSAIKNQSLPAVTALAPHIELRDAQNATGQTPLLLAAQQLNPTFVAILALNGAHDQADNTGMTALKFCQQSLMETPKRTALETMSLTSSKQKELSETDKEKLHQILAILKAKQNLIDRLENDIARLTEAKDVITIGTDLVNSMNVSTHDEIDNVERHIETIAGDQRGQLKQINRALSQG